MAGGYLFAQKVFRMTGKIPGSRVSAPAMVAGQLKMLPGTIEASATGLLQVRLDTGETVQASPDRVIAEKRPRISPERMGYGHVLQYLDQYGDPHIAALEYAKDLNVDVNFDYSAADLPKLFRINLGCRASRPSRRTMNLIQKPPKSKENRVNHRLSHPGDATCATWIFGNRL